MGNFNGKLGGKANNLKYKLDSKGKSSSNNGVEKLLKYDKEIFTFCKNKTKNA